MWLLIFLLPFCFSQETSITIHSGMLIVPDETRVVLGVVTSTPESFPDGECESTGVNCSGAVLYTCAAPDDIQFSLKAGIYYIVGFLRTGDDQQPSSKFQVGPSDTEDGVCNQTVDRIFTSGQENVGWITQEVDHHLSVSLIDMTLDFDPTRAQFSFVNYASTCYSCSSSSKQQLKEMRHNLLTKIVA